MGKNASTNTRFTVRPSNIHHKPFYLRALQVILGSAIMAIAMNMFVEHIGLLPAGFTGLAKLLQRIAVQKFSIEIPFTVLIIALNLLPAIYTFFHVGRKFVGLSILSIVVSGIFIDLIPEIPLTTDPVLSTIFAGVINGFGVSVILNADASTGGTDFIAMALSNKYNVATWNYMMIFNGVLLAISAFFFGIEAALYSIVYQFISTQIVNRGHLRYQRRTCFIITNEPEVLSQELMKLTHHGVTSFKGIGCYSGQEQYLLYMVVGRRDVRQIKKYLKEHAPGTFLNITDSEQLGGNFYVDPID